MQSYTISHDVLKPSTGVGSSGFIVFCRLTTLSSHLTKNVWRNDGTRKTTEIPKAGIESARSNDLEEKRSWHACRRARVVSVRQRKRFAKLDLAHRRAWEEARYRPWWT